MPINAFASQRTQQYRQLFKFEMTQHQTNRSTNRYQLVVQPTKDTYHFRESFLLATNC